MNRLIHVQMEGVQLDTLQKGEQLLHLLGKMLPVC